MIFTDEMPSGTSDLIGYCLDLGYIEGEEEVPDFLENLLSDTKSLMKGHFADEDRLLTEFINSLRNYVGDDKELEERYDAAILSLIAFIGARELLKENINKDFIVTNVSGFVLFITIKE